MLKSGEDAFVHFAGGSKLRVLHAAKVTDRRDDIITVGYAHPDSLPSEPKPMMTVFFNGPAEFMQQAGELVEFENAEGELVAGIQLFGEPVSAESRKCFRVCTVLAEYTAGFGILGTCKLVDVSAAGVGFLSDERLLLGDSVEIKLTVLGKTSTGRGFIQSMQEVRDGFRYGLLCTEDGNTGGLNKGLQRLTMDAQRTQLRRLSGAA